MLLLHTASILFFSCLHVVMATNDTVMQSTSSRTDPSCQCNLRRYVTFALGAAAEVVALLVAGPAVDKIGRHSVVSIGLLLGGAANLACANVTAQTAQAVLSAIGKFGCSGAVSLGCLLTITSACPGCAVTATSCLCPLAIGLCNSTL